MRTVTSMSSTSPVAGMTSVEMLVVRSAMKRGTSTLSKVLVCGGPYPKRPTARSRVSVVTPLVAIVTTKNVSVVPQGTLFATW